MRQANKENKQPKSKGPASNCPGKARLWTIEAVMNGEMGQNRVAMEYGVPHTTRYLEEFCSREGLKP